MARRIAQTNSSFSSGVFAPSMEARKDLERYRDAAQEAQNFTVLTHGGMQRRGGLRFGCEFVDAATGAELTKFEFNNEQNYVMGLTDAKLTVFRNWAKETDIAAPWDTDKLRIGFSSIQPI